MNTTKISRRQLLAISVSSASVACFSQALVAIPGEKRADCLLGSPLDIACADSGSNADSSPLLPMTRRVSDQQTGPSASKFTLLNSANLEACCFSQIELTMNHRVHGSDDRIIAVHYWSYRSGEQAYTSNAVDAAMNLGNCEGFDLGLEGKSYPLKLPTNAESSLIAGIYAISLLADSPVNWQQCLLDTQQRLLVSDSDKEAVAWPYLLLAIDV